MVFALTRFDAVRAELTRIARDSGPSATADTRWSLPVLVIVGGGLLLGVAGASFALGLRAGRRWRG
ncbi:hypothetical protein [Actinophytocola sp.]|uniref:hypothetical protein n=1 Tax=Actinophytocola sp. TaxID=1872138 RepID=UPI003899ECE6